MAMPTTSADAPPDRAMGQAPHAHRGNFLGAAAVRGRAARRDSGHEFLERNLLRPRSLLEAGRSHTSNERHNETQQ
jgi:hypothetical protein